MFKPIPFAIDNDRFYYEPRVLWSTARIGASIEARSSTQPGGYQPLPKEHYRNGSRWPIRITHALISPVGYLLASGNADDESVFDQAMAAISRTNLRIAFPKSSWIERLDTDVLNFATEATAEPGFLGDPDLEYASGLFGTSRWTFDPSYIVPRKVTLDLILSTIQLYNTGEVRPVGSASLAFFERGGRMLGHSRSRPSAPLEYAPTWQIANGAWPDANTPIIGDGYAINLGVSGPQKQTFPGQQKWPSNLYLHQLASRGLPYTEVTGFSVAIDQIDIDDQVTNLDGAGLFSDARVAPIAQRIITKASTRDGGTQERWWRDGAPLSLVTPTQNNCAFVHKFADPFIIGPGDGMEVGLQAPAARTVNDVPILGPYNVGVSFLGYACVEDNDKKVYR